MDDDRIVQLYWDRNEAAITASSQKYGAYCLAIARNILSDRLDAEECVNDTWLRAWNAMPPHRPSLLAAFLGKITRHLSFDRYKKLHREKRGGHQLDAVLDELAECVSGADDTERQWEEKALIEEINRFLFRLPEDRRYLFIRRYWYADSISQIAGRMNMSVNQVSVILSRLRHRLKDDLIERGFDI